MKLVILAKNSKFTLPRLKELTSATSVKRLTKKDNESLIQLVEYSMHLGSIQNTNGCKIYFISDDAASDFLRLHVDDVLACTVIDERKIDLYRFAMFLFLRRPTSLKDSKDVEDVLLVLYKDLVDNNIISMSKSAFLQVIHSDSKNISSDLMTYLKRITTTAW